MTIVSAVDEVGIDHVREAGDELRPAFLLLAIDEQYEPDAASGERQQQHSRIEHQDTIISPAISMARSKITPQAILSPNR